MNIRIDAKGKYYTDIVRKEEVPVVIQTVTNLVRGNIFLRPEQRVKDGLNETDESFIAVSDAEVFGPGGQPLYRAHFLTVNKRHIVWLKPDEGTVNDDPAEQDPAGHESGAEA